MIPFIVSLTLSGAAPPAGRPGPVGPADSTRAMAFDRADRRSRELLTILRCARSAAPARAQGLFGPPDSLGGSGTCLFAGGHFVGIYYTVDSTYSHLLRLNAVDLVTRLPYSGVDSTRLLAEARARDDAIGRGYRAFAKVNRSFGPLTIRFDGDSIEVWLIPLRVVSGSLETAVGGEHGFVYTPDGRTLVREIDAFAQYRELALPDTGSVVLRSREPDLPLTSELLLANALNAAGRWVTIETGSFAATLAGQGNSALWIQIPRNAGSATQQNPKKPKRRCSGDPPDSLRLARGPVYRDCEVDRPAELRTTDAPLSFNPTASRSGRCLKAELQFVVDALGQPELGDVRGRSGNDRDLEDAIRLLLPTLRYSPARLGDQPVRQLVVYARAVITVLRVTTSSGAPVGLPPPLPLTPGC